MAAGLPVVATRVGGNIELVDEGVTGMLFTPGSAEQLAAAFEMLIRSPELRRQMGQDGRSRVIANYHMDVVLNKFRTLYATLLKEKGVC
jgi:glycosyltransferase involved in cell wall biosynthesis